MNLLPAGKYKESSLAVMREAMPLLVQELQTEMFREVRSGMDKQMVEHEQAMKEYEQKKKRDRELCAQAYLLPKDSIAVVPGKVYENRECLQLLHYIRLKEEKRIQK